MRDQGIYYPWFARDADHVIDREPFLATMMVHERVCSLTAAGDHYRTAYHAHFRYQTNKRLAGRPVPTLVATTQWDPNFETTRAAASAAPKAAFALLDPDFSQWIASFSSFLDQEG